MIFILLAVFALLVLLGLVLRHALDLDRPQSRDIVEQLLGYQRAQAVRLPAPPIPDGKPVWLEPTPALRKRQHRATLWWRYAPVWGSVMMTMAIVVTYWLASMPGHPAPAAALGLFASFITIDALRSSQREVRDHQFTLGIDGSVVLLRDFHGNTQHFAAHQMLFDGTTLLLGRHAMPLLRQAPVNVRVEQGGSKEPLFERQAFIQSMLPVLTNGVALTSQLRIRQQLLRQQNRLWLTRAICVTPGITLLLIL